MLSNGPNTEAWVTAAKRFSQKDVCAFRKTHSFPEHK